MAARCTYNVYLRLTNSSEPQRVQVAVLLKLCAEKTVLVSLLPNLAVVGGAEGIIVSAFNGKPVIKVFQDTLQKLQVFKNQV